ncbi:ABC transporter ATP-binding protein [Phyllobacterium myrsinacearum]|uniref:Polyamine ABC transporter ATP-binding protein n=1 Tax=Phyllobacterium myrsinacearum TaxID=28101 RepID=A0A2S9JQY1_9HYPH|nr:ABC transporter ATP-binding protein [Phyllobacterium myrsinacearum]PRD55591.1 polyamine ABC transporter ATP-binding protein [Phyllobacterium myrsinacearum]PWV91947.1 putative spermidine/putrescine transport system ATP-binding protein [Phyllobacterium myrsinacearum]RZV06014.1 putative spermidine/putrescine transport system ATP-binding protein [Phyllobacterium myrsinacearum]
MTQSFLSIRGIRKTYGQVTAVKNVTMDVAEGEFMTFLGPSGSGKSTTLYILAGFQDPTDGDILLKGQSLLSTPSHKRNIGMVFQRYTLFPHLTVGENVAFPLRVRRVGQAEITDRVKKALKLVRLEGLEERKPALMSGGQQQRVALARALVYNPPVLLMDEPLSALDKKLREEIQFEIRRIHQETGVTILYVTHDQEEALRLSDRIAVFSQGEIDQIGTGRELYADPATHFVAGFIGDSNFINAEVLSNTDGNARLLLPGGTVVDGVPMHAGKAGGTSASLLLRPERLSLSSTRIDNGLTVTIKDITFLGNNIEVSTQTGNGEILSVRLPFGHEAISGISRGDQAWLSFEPKSTHAFV